MKKNLFIGVSLTVGIPTTTMAQQKQPEHPNLIFIITDQLRNDVFGCRGDEIAKTPNIVLRRKVLTLQMPWLLLRCRQQHGPLFLLESIHPAREWSLMNFV